MPTKRKALALPVPQSRDEAVEQVAQIGALRRQIAAIKARAAAQLAKIGEAVEEAVEPLEVELNAMEKGLQSYCEANRSDLTRNGKVKFHRFATGKVSWRKRPAKVSIKGAKDVIARLKEHGLKRFIRTEETIDKEAMLKEASAAEAIEGVTIRSAGEDFAIEPAEVETDAGRAA
jgi:phage host-nuclease inhibitor protein Gam